MFFGGKDEEKDLSALEKKRASMQKVVAMKKQEETMKKEIQRLEYRRSTSKERKERSELSAAIMLKRRRHLAQMQNIVKLLKEIYK